LEIGKSTSWGLGVVENWCFYLTSELKKGLHLPTDCDN